MSESAPTNLNIRMPTPTGTYSTTWANSLVNSLELQTRNIILSQNSSSKTTQEISEAVSWFNG
jgi:hypothetical protein